MAKKRKDKTNEVRDWYFTFGAKHAHPNGYVKIRGTHSEARAKMHKRFSTKWKSQYASAKFAGVDKFNLYEI